MKPLDWLVLLVGLFWTWAFIGGIIFTNPIVFQLAGDAAWKVVGRRFFAAVCCFGFLAWRLWG